MSEEQDKKDRRVLINLLHAGGAELYFAGEVITAFWIWQKFNASYDALKTLEGALLKISAPETKVRSRR